MASLRCHYDAAFKSKVIAEAEATGNCTASRKFDVPENNVRRWRKQKTALLACAATRKAFRGPRKGAFPEVEEVLTDSVKERRCRGLALTAGIAQMKARKIARERGIPALKFKASRGWVQNCSALHTTCELQNIELKFLPANTKAKLQPLNSDIMKSFKVGYRSRLLDKLLVNLRVGTELAGDLFGAIQMMMGACLVLPRGINTRLQHPNWRQVNHFSRQAHRFNSRLVNLCESRQNVFFIDHAIHHFPAQMVLAADGAHPNLTGVSLLAWNIYNVILHTQRDHMGAWRDQVPTAERSQPVPSKLSFAEALKSSIGAKGSQAVAQGTAKTPTHSKKKQVTKTPSCTHRDHGNLVAESHRVSTNSSEDRDGHINGWGKKTI
ncbi:hypothetical protein HPB51_001550 [Rhipicephalus microplus]|uniref:HTH CENPB-type domain-containing protein n=1 Tax=Rhipicephalus microplus TaxID=6941 RepID=A0A9J6EV88_RHIMP|nr:hypothetical protein HPB51_001550 [Rhipicephalus microplus]